MAIVARVEKLRPRVFLSHNWQDKSVARLTAHKPNARGIGVLLDEAEIKLGDSLTQNISSGIDEVEYVVALVSQSSINSGWVGKELDIAMNQEIENRRVKLLAVRLDDSDLPLFLRGKLYADLRSPKNIEAVTATIEASLQV